MLIKRHSLKRVRLQDWVAENGLDIEASETEDGRWATTLIAGSSPTENTHLIVFAVSEYLKDIQSRVGYFPTQKPTINESISKLADCLSGNTFAGADGYITIPMFFPYQPDENDVIEEVGG